MHRDDMMSYVYMRALETAPERYDQGIRWLGWNRLDRIRNKMADAMAASAKTVLEIGVGTGTQALLLAQRGMTVVGIDHSQGMLGIAKKKLDVFASESESNAQVASRVQLQQKAAVQLDEFPENSFDAVTATLVFSELSKAEQRYVLAHAFRLLRPGGMLVLADEVMPKNLAKRVVHGALAAILKAITYLATQTSTHPVRDLEQKVVNAGFEIQSIDHHQLDSFEVLYAKKPEAAGSQALRMEQFEPIARPHSGIGMRIWTTLARMIAHPTEIGLIAINEPSPEDPVLCTCNFVLTVSRLCDLLEKEHISAWVLVAPTDGVNVWCSSCGGDFNAGSVITAIKISGLEGHVSHRTIILPQLSASGIDPKEVMNVTGWHCAWGPVQMDDLPEFLHEYPHSVRHKTERQRKVRFELSFRMEMASALAFPILLVLGLPILLILALINLQAWILPMFLLMVFYFYVLFAVWPHLPSRFGTKKVVAWTIFTLILLMTLSWTLNEVWQIQFFLLFHFNGLLASLNLWPLFLLTFVLFTITVFDADGMTPNLRSSYFARSWNKGKLKIMERWGVSYKVTPYGRITLKYDLCTGCGVCVDVCPMIIPQLDSSLRKANLTTPELCVNCRACVYRCPVDALFLEPETPEARKALARFLAGDAN